MKCEKPKHTVLRTLGSRKDWMGRSKPLVEIRRYAPYLMAELAVESGEMRDALSTGFRAIAGFIFGKNKEPESSSSQKVAMTSPVTLEMVEPRPATVAMTAPVAAEILGASKYKISFIMPSKYTAATLPRPDNPDVHIVEVPARTLAALAWRGGSPRDGGEVRARADRLRAALKQEGLEPVGSLHLWQYHPPFAPAWMRRNEVLLEIKEGDGVAKS